MNENEIGYVIKNKEFTEAYLGHNDAFVTKIRSALIFPDYVAANHKVFKLKEEQLSFKINNVLEVLPVRVSLVEEKSNKLNVANFTFERTRTLFEEDAIMVLRNNKEKTHVVTLTEQHIKRMEANGYDTENSDHILSYLIHNKYL